MEFVSLIDKSSFIGLDACNWLYSGAETPPHKGCIAQINEYMINRAKGPEGRERNTEIENSCKRNLAALLNGRPEQIAFLSNSSEIIGIIAQSLAFKPGDNVVINTLEFPSGVLPWLRLKEMGLEVRVVNHHQWEIQVESVLQRVDDRTRLVVSSHVSYMSGARFDYKGLYASLSSTNALFLLDVTQSLGAIPVDMNYSDFVVCSSYKWLLSIHGVGILAINPKKTSEFLPSSAGWRSAVNMFSPIRFETFEYFHDVRKFETGFPAYSAIYTLNFSTRLLLDIGIERIERHILDLGTQMINVMRDRGYTVMTPETPQHRAGNISMVCSEGEAVAEQMRRNRVFVWGGDGRLRASVHLFNDTSDVRALAFHLPNLKS